MGGAPSPPAARAGRAGQDTARAHRSCSKRRAADGARETSGSAQLELVVYIHTHRQCKLLRPDASCGSSDWRRARREGVSDCRQLHAQHHTPRHSSSAPTRHGTRTPFSDVQCWAGARPTCARAVMLTPRRNLFAACASRLGVSFGIAITTTTVVATTTSRGSQRSTSRASGRAAARQRRRRRI